MPLSTRRHSRNLLIALVAVLAATLVQASAAFASVLWSADAERTWSQEWANYSCEDATRVQQVSDRVAQGAKAYQIEVRDGDDSYGERCELGQGNPTKSGFPLFQEGHERWISFQVLLPDDYPINASTWNVIFQLKQLGSMGTPAVSMEVQNGRFVLMNSDNNTVSGRTVPKWNGPAVRNRWVKFTMHTKFSPNANVGSIELFGDLDGQGVKLLMPETNMHTMKLDPAGLAVTSHARLGMYRNPSIQGTAHILYDGYTIATDRDSAEGAAFGGGTGEQPVGQAPTPVSPAPGTTTPTTDPGSKTTKPRRSKAKRRVVLRTARRRSRGLRSAGVWPRVLPVYGWVRTNGNVGRRSVVIEIRRNGRWQWLTRGWLRRNGRFYLAPSLDTGVRRTFKLRARVKGVGVSATLTARV